MARLPRAQRDTDIFIPLDFIPRCCCHQLNKTLKCTAKNTKKQHDDLKLKLIFIYFILPRSTSPAQISFHVDFLVDSWIWIGLNNSVACSMHLVISFRIPLRNYFMTNQIEENSYHKLRRHRKALYKNLKYIRTLIFNASHFKNGL